MRYRIITFIFFFNTLTLFSQKEETPKCLEIDDKEAISNYEKGTDKKKYKKEERVPFLEKALEIEPDYPAANFALAQEKVATIKFRGGNYESIIPYMQKVVEKCPKYHSDPYYFLGFAYYEKENNVEAIKWLEKFINFSDDDDTKFAKDYDVKLGQSKEMLKYAKIYKHIDDLKANPVPFDPFPINSVCTEHDEYLPIISPDNELILYTRRMPFTSKNQTWQSDKLIEVFSVSKRTSVNNFEKGGAMPSPPFNKNENEGGATLSIDNKHLFYTICRDEGGAQMNCDIYYSNLVDGKWTEVQKVEGINDKINWDSQPSISSDGKTLYFASDRNGGFGGIDIYKTVLDKTTGIWGTPENLGPTINTAGNDKSPFIHSDSETLYFSSDGQQVSFGGFDIFYVKKNDEGKWTEPKNIGYPINNETDDLGFFAGLDGKYGYFATRDRAKAKGRSMGGWDLYSFELYEAARPEEIRYITGKLRTETGQPLTGAKVEIKSSESKTQTDVAVDTITGEYRAIVNVRKKEDFLLTVTKEGYAFNSQLVTVSDTLNKTIVNTAEPVKIDFDVKPIEVGKNYTLNDIYYNSSSAELKKKSLVVIEEFVKFLNENPTVKIEIHGYTDNVGSDDANIKLSNERAFTVHDKLQSKGIDGSRLVKYEGFGKANPIASNDTEAGRAKNRRTEFVIVEK